jgi:sucrose phosphorylase
MKFNSKIMLITYADSMGANLKELGYALNKYYNGIIGGIHILPFFPSSADRGFAPKRYDMVDEKFGSWDDIKSLSEKYYLMFDFMINHISRSSEYFRDFLKRGDASPCKDMFIRYKDFWSLGEPTAEEVDRIYKRKPRAPYTIANFDGGGSEKVWCTFGEEQIDLNVETDLTKRFIKDTIQSMSEHHAGIIRLDAFAYSIKKAGTSCFFIEPEVWNLLYSINDMLKPYNKFILPEIHEHYSLQLKLAEKGFFTYDFSLPMLVLYALYVGKTAYLKHWLKICPRKQFTTLDTHDGIGIVDVKGLMSDEDILAAKELLFKKGANVKKIYNTEAYNNLDIYQLNCTYYSALGNNGDAYILARAIQFFAPGVPMVYYVGLLAGANDIKLMESTKNGRDINRHFYTIEEIEENQKRPVLKKLYRLMKFRNSHPAFDGSCIVSQTPDNILEIVRESCGEKAVLHADVQSLKFSIEYTDKDGHIESLDLGV